MECPAQRGKDRNTPANTVNTPPLTLAVMEVHEKSQTIDPEIRAYVYSLVNALGGRSTYDDSYGMRIATSSGLRHPSNRMQQLATMRPRYSKT